jgi:glycosyltransferase involved in cell wall biosynthesis
VPPRVAVIIPCFNSDPLLREAVVSLQEAEPLEVLVVDDASTDPATLEVLAQLEGDGVTVLRLTVNGGVARARAAGVAATSAPYVFPLDADDLAIEGHIARAADRLDADPAAAACVGDYEEFGTDTIIRVVPDVLDPYRVAYTNEYAITALMRRTVLERYGGWRDPSPTARGYEDWHVWMDLAEGGEKIVHLGGLLYRRRMHAPGLDVKQRERHAELYRALRDEHPMLFAHLGEYRRRTTLSPPRAFLYPLLYGERRLINRVRFVKPLLDRAGVWTLARRQR